MKNNREIIFKYSIFQCFKILCSYNIDFTLYRLFRSKTGCYSIFNYFFFHQIILLFYILIGNISFLDYLDILFQEMYFFIKYINNNALQ